jgi:glycosyltransferase involved in cell wall biosynthesis
VRVAITFSYAIAFGGAERVLEVLADIFSDADFFCLFVDPRHIPKALRGRNITTSFLDRLPLIKRHNQSFFPLYPLAAESLNLRGYDLVISSDGMATKGVITDENAVHVCYCHSPHRSLWDQYTSYLTTLSGAKKMLFTLGSHYVRHWDFNAAQRVDVLIANSQYIADRIRKYYGRDSVVIYPPVNTNRGFISPLQGDYYLTVSRLAALKRTEIIVQACTALNRRLLVAGTGEEMNRLKAMAGPTVEFLGFVEEARLSELYSQCRAFLFAAEEDFGIAPVEAQMYGRPVIALGRGGALESVKGWTGNKHNAVNRSTGILFEQQTSDSLVRAIKLFESVERDFDPEYIRSVARRFDTSVFSDHMTALLRTLRIGASRKNAENSAECPIPALSTTNVALALADRGDEIQ